MGKGEIISIVDPPRDEEQLDISKLVDEAVSSRTRGLLESLECSVCFDTMLPPIHQCPNGHTLCSTCKPRVRNRCPTCSEELGNIRCLALEKAAAFVELPCKYQDSGCLGVFPYCNKLDHESQCSFRRYKCPLSGSKCSISGDIPFLISHVADYHKVLINDYKSFTNRYRLRNQHGVQKSKWRPTVFRCFGQYFFLHFKAIELGKASVWIAFLQFMGNDEAAKNYRYSLECEGKGRKMKWQGVPRSITVSIDKVCDHLDGLIIQPNFLSNGEGKEQKVTVIGRIFESRKSSQFVEA